MLIHSAVTFGTLTGHEYNAGRDFKQNPDFGETFRFVFITSRNEKVKFTLEHAAKAQRGSRGIALHFLQPRR